MTIYTRKGDTGETGRLGKGRIRKDDPVIEAIGAVDELNSFLGLARALVTDPEVEKVLHTLQKDLFAVGADLAAHEAPGARIKRKPQVDVRMVRSMEETIDRLSDELGTLRRFITPAGVTGAAVLHVARAVARRAERATVVLSAERELSPALLSYMNRISDLLFVLARIENQRSGGSEEEWRGLAGGEC